MDLTPEISSAEAVQKAKEAAAAVETARQAQMDASNIESEKRITIAFTEALKKAFEIEETGGQKRFIDITRIPLICQDIRQMHGDISDIKGNIKWGVRLVIGVVLTALIGLIIKS